MRHRCKFMSTVMFGCRKFGACATAISCPQLCCLPSDHRQHKRHCISMLTRKFAASCTACTYTPFQKMPSSKSLNSLWLASTAQHRLAETSTQHLLESKLSSL